MVLDQQEFDARWMNEAIEVSKLCPPSETAFSVGAIVVDDQGDELARGYSRETGPTVHAEESALAKLTDTDLAGCTLYSTLEPCSQRTSRPISCTQLILAAQIRRVVIAWREPSLFVADPMGVELLTAAGVDVAEMPAEFARRAKAVHTHLRLPPVR